MDKGTSLEIDLPCSGKGDRRGGPAQPPLVVEVVVAIGPFHLGSYTVSLCQVHPRLQGHVPFLGGACPRGMTKPDVLETDMLYRPIECSFYRHKCFYRGNHGIQGIHILVIPRDVV